MYLKLTRSLLKVCKNEYSTRDVISRDEDTATATRLNLNRINSWKKSKFLHQISVDENVQKLFLASNISQSRNFQPS